MRTGRGFKTAQRHRDFLKGVLDRLGAGETLRTADLADEFGVAQRTIHRAICELRDEGHDIKGSAGLGGGVRLSTKQEAA